MQPREYPFRNSLFWIGLQRFLRIMMIVCSILSTGCMVYAVIWRYFFQGNFYGSDEVIMLFAFWLYFMGAAYGSFENTHIKADLLQVYIHNLRTKDTVALIAQLLTVAVNTVILIWATEYFFSEIEKWGLSTALKIPLIIPKSSVFFGILLMEFYHVYYLICDIIAFRKFGVFSQPQPGDFVTESFKKRYPDCTVPLKQNINKKEAD